MAKRFTKPSINWAELEKRVPPEQRTKFLTFKGKSDGYLRRVLSNPPEPPKIDWAHYQKMVPIPGLVDKFKKDYESFKVPFPQDTMSASIEKQWGELQGQINNFCKERDTDIAASQKELDKINALPPFETITLEMYHDMYPDKALDPVNKPSFWPHNPEEQPGYQAEGPKVEGGH